MSIQVSLSGMAKLLAKVPLSLLRILFYKGTEVTEAAVVIHEA